MSAARALARVGWRDITRHRLRSLLIVLLIALPVAAMVGGIAILRTTQVTPERWATARFGQADLFAQPSDGASVDLLRNRLPPGTAIEPYVETQARLVLPGVRPTVSVRAADIDGLAGGILTLVSGRPPRGGGEAAIASEVARIASVGIGDRVTVDGLGELEVVGIVENPLYLAERVVDVDPTAYHQQAMDYGGWLIKLPPGMDPGAYGGGLQDPATGAVLFSISVRGQSGGSFDTSPTVLILGALALVESALIASAAFAVSIRRRQRELGLLAATGATSGQLSRSVRVEALLLGIFAAAAGAVVGLLAAAALGPWLDQLTQHRNPPIVVDASGFLGPIAIGLIAALVAAFIPARTVARMPVLLSLSGRRPSHRSAGRGLWLGIVVVLIGLTSTIAGATFDFDNGDVRQYLILVGAVLGTLGFGACAPWLLERLDRLAWRLPVSPRIAFRDTARARSRNAPIVTAVLASLAAVIAIGAWSASRDAEELAGWHPTLWPDQVRISGAGAGTVAQMLLAEPGVTSATRITTLVPKDSTSWPFFTLPDARDAKGRLINLVDDCTNCTPGAFEPYQAIQVAAPSPELLALRHADAAAADLANGTVVVVSDRVSSATTMRILVDHGDGRDPVGISVPVHVIHTDVSAGVLPDAFLPESLIAQLGLVETDAHTYGDEATYVVQYDHSVSSSEFDTVVSYAAREIDTVAGLDSAPVLPGQGFRLLLIALVLLFALSVTGIALALGEAESRQDQRTLLALGAEPRLRRRIAASRAAALAFVAGTLAVPAGLLPVWGIFASREATMTMPGLEIAGALVAMPLLAVVLAWFLSRPIPDWSAFRNLEAR